MPNRADMGINFRMGSMKMDTPDEKKKEDKHGPFFQTNYEYMFFFSVLLSTKLNENE